MWIPSALLKNPSIYKNGGIIETQKHNFYEFWGTEIDPTDLLKIINPENWQPTT
jgi:hypothetical protein